MLYPYLIAAPIVLGKRPGLVIYICKHDRDHVCKLYGSIYLVVNLWSKLLELQRIYRICHPLQCYQHKGSDSSAGHIFLGVCGYMYRYFFKLAMPIFILPLSILPEIHISTYIPHFEGLYFHDVHKASLKCKKMCQVMKCHHFYFYNRIQIL